MSYFDDSFGTSAAVADGDVETVEDLRTELDNAVRLGAELVSRIRTLESINLRLEGEKVELQNDCARLNADINGREATCVYLANEVEEVRLHHSRSEKVRELLVTEVEAARGEAAALKQMLDAPPTGSPRHSRSASPARFPLHSDTRSIESRRSTEGGLLPGAESTVALEEEVLDLRAQVTALAEENEKLRTDLLEITKNPIVPPSPSLHPREGAPGSDTALLTSRSILSDGMAVNSSFPGLQSHNGSLTPEAPFRGAGTPRPVPNINFSGLHRRDSANNTPRYMLVTPREINIGLGNHSTLDLSANQNQSLGYGKSRVHDAPQLHQKRIDRFFSVLDDGKPNAFLDNALDEYMGHFDAMSNSSTLGGGTGSGRTKSGAKGSSSRRGAGPTPQGSMGSDGCQPSAEIMQLVSESRKLIRGIMR